MTRLSDIARIARRDAREGHGYRCPVYVSTYERYVYEECFKLAVKERREGKGK